MTSARKRSPKDRGAKRRLLAAALTLFGSQGFEATSVRQLAKQAKGSTGLVRKYYGSKDGLRTAVDRFVLDEMRGYYASAFDPSGPDVVGKMVDQAVAFAKRDRNVLSYLRYSLLHPRESSLVLVTEYYEIHEKFIEDLKRNGLLSPAADVRWAPFVFMFLQLGPLVMEPFSKLLLGESMYSSRMVRQRNNEYTRLLTAGLIRSSAGSLSKH